MLSLCGLCVDCALGSGGPCERARWAAVSRVQGRCFRPTPLTCATECLGPLEPRLRLQRDHASTREEIERRPKNLWRYRELLPIDGEPRTGFNSGFTPLVPLRPAGRSGSALRELYVKDDSVNHPTLSYKDRVVSVAATRAVELGFKVLACASTGNLANSVAAHAARLGVECCVFIPDNLEAGKLLGSAIFNPTILAHRRQLRRREPAVHAGGGSLRLGLRQHQPARHTTPKARRRMGSRSSSSSAGAIRSTSCRRSPAARCCRASSAASASCETIGLVDGELPRVHAAQAAGCAPVVQRARGGARSSRAGAAEHDRRSRSRSATRPTAIR